MGSNSSRGQLIMEVLCLIMTLFVVGATIFYLLETIEAKRHTHKFSTHERRLEKRR